MYGLLCIGILVSNLAAQKPFIVISGFSDIFLLGITKQELSEELPSVIE